VKIGAGIITNTLKKKHPVVQPDSEQTELLFNGGFTSQEDCQITSKGQGWI
jgi:hypothetical protein